MKAIDAEWLIGQGISVCLGMWVGFEYSWAAGAVTLYALVVLVDLRSK